MPSKASASSSGASVTAKPRRMRARIASWSCVIETRFGVKPAARHVRTIRPSLSAAVQSSSRRSAMRTAGRCASPWPGGSATMKRSRRRSRRSRSGGSSRGCVVSSKPSARCSSPVRTRSGRSSPPSSTLTFTSGWRSRRRARAAGTSPASAVGKAPMRSRTRRPWAAAAIWAPASWKRSAMASACASRISPSRVSRRPPGRRSSRLAPISRSSAATWLETDGWDSASARAAPENERWCATARNVSTRRGSIAGDYRTAEIAI